MRAVFHSEARLELAEAARWYSAQSRGLGSDLRREVKAAVARIVANPERFGILEEDIRCCLVHRFPYGILFAIRPDRILIVAVMHLHRAPGYWKSRVRPGASST
jgi:hypothetical protein